MLQNSEAEGDDQPRAKVEVSEDDDTQPLGKKPKVAQPKAKKHKASSSGEDCDCDPGFSGKTFRDAKKDESKCFRGL